MLRFGLLKVPVLNRQRYNSVQLFKRSRRRETSLFLSRFKRDHRSTKEKRSGSSAIFLGMGFAVSVIIFFGEVLRGGSTRLLSRGSELRASIRNRFGGFLGCSSPGTPLSRVSGDSLIGTTYGKQRDASIRFVQEFDGFS